MNILDNAGISYTDFLSFITAEIDVRLSICKTNSADSAQYLISLNSAKTLLEMFSTLGDHIINKYIFDNQLSSDGYQAVRERFIGDLKRLKEALTVFQI